METISVNTWEQFEEQIRALKPPSRGNYLYRGQGNADWGLETTLERKGQKDILFSSYYRKVEVIRSQVESFTGQGWRELPDFPTVAKTFSEYDRGSLAFDGIGMPFPAYSYLTYLRHHSFPSPLLDWSRSPYVAAYFAFRNATSGCVAIYIYSERPENFKSSSSDEPQIKSFGPYVKTHRRHFLQQSTYTICVKFDLPAGWRFSPHESVFSLNASHQDLLWKIMIPSSERVKVLKQSDAYNLNAFSLFDSEEALMETLAFRHIDFTQHTVEPNANKLNSDE